MEGKQNEQKTKKIFLLYYCFLFLLLLWLWFSIAIPIVTAMRIPAAMMNILSLGLFMANMMMIVTIVINVGIKMLDFIIAIDAI